MPARAVVLPGTSLLVPGAGGGADLLGDVRVVVAGALDRLVAASVALAPPGGDGDAPLVVLAPVPRGASGGFGRRRPSLAGAGIADRWVPDVAAWAGADPAPVPPAHVPASVALLALRAAARRAGHDGPPDVVVLEVSDAAEVPAEAVTALRRAPAVVVAGGAAPGTPGAAAVPDPAPDPAPGPAPGPVSGGPVLLAPAVAALLDVAAAPGRWSWRVTTVPGGHEHLPASYGVAEGSAG
ncbi:hypothetical protein ACFQ80_09245 [Isoptericola sp. NPDC056578]|uniref:hypothetical protein n=1 Tax=Isoptericola sp. NPDC056578 TaxID=3345870 RepID=UPI003688EF56